MRRRTILALAPALLPGCSTLDSDSTSTVGSPTGTNRSQIATDSTSTPEPDRTVIGDEGYDLVPEPSRSLTVEQVESRLSSQDCTGVTEVETYCPGDDGPVSVSVTPRVTSLPTGTVEVTLSNEADETFEWNPYDWRLFVHGDGEWRHLAPLANLSPLDSLGPGESYTYGLTVDTTTFSGDDYFQQVKNIEMTGLGPGIYGFVTDGWMADTRGEEFALAGLFGIAGDEPAMRPTPDVMQVVRRDSTLIVKASDRGTSPRDVVVTLTDRKPDYVFLPEEVRQPAALANTLSYAATEDVTEIRYLTSLAEANDAKERIEFVSPDGTVGIYGFRDYAFEFRIEDPAQPLGSATVSGAERPGARRSADQTPDRHLLRASALSGRRGAPPRPHVEL